MIRRPPRVATWLLALTPAAYRSYLAADLEEEFTTENRSNAWYWRQVGRSLPSILTLHLRQPEQVNARLEATTALLLTSAWLLVAWHFLWTYVLSQVPLKADPTRWFQL